MYEADKASSKRQWQERSERPIAARQMSRDDILHFQKLLAVSYKCDSNDDIIYDFEKILDENDEDRDDCLLLVYRMKCYDVNGKALFRPVFRTKLPIPEKMRESWERTRYEMMNQRQLPNVTPPRLSLPSAVATASAPVDPAPTMPSVPRPKLKRQIIRRPV